MLPEYARTGSGKSASFVGPSDVALRRAAVVLREVAAREVKP